VKLPMRISLRDAAMFVLVVAAAALFVVCAFMLAANF
jgi:hypothetical protein